MTGRSTTLAVGGIFLVSLVASSHVRAQKQAGAHWDSTHVSDWLNALPVSRAALAEYHRRKEAGLLPVAAKSTSEVGDTLTFKVWNFRKSRSTLVVLDSIDFRLELESEDVRLWVELAELDSGRVSQLKVENLFRALAEETPFALVDPGRGIIPNCEALFGAPPDVNGDGFVDVLLLHIRDDDAVLGINVGGFVWSGDLTEVGNGRDIVYVDSGADQASVVAHEYQHLIHFNYDLRELRFVNEGLSRLSEIVNGYPPRDISYLDPLSYDAPLLRFGTQLSQDIQFTQADYLRAGLFTMYMAERIGYEAAGAITRDSVRQGVDSYAAALDQHGIALEDFILDFHVANVLNRVDLYERYGYRTPVYKFVKYLPLHDIDGRITEETAPTEVKVKEGAPTYFVWRHAPNLSIAVTPERDSTALRGLVLLQRDGRVEVAPLPIGSQATAFEGTYDRVTLLVAHVHPTNTGRGFGRFVLNSSWESASGLQGNFVRDLESLKALYDSTGGASWANRDGWSFAGAPTPEELAMWHGVEIESGRVSGLRLNGNGLSGAIPDAIGDLSALQSLTLARDSLRGAIPATVGKLLQLQNLVLRVNDLEGPIPPEIAELDRLSTLGLDSNRLTGEIPSGLGNLSELTHLFLNQNELTGEIPEELGALTSLLWLTLANNRLTGTIPRALGNAASLRRLGLEHNELAGPIPREFGDLSQLQTLNVNGNALTGPIPTELGRLRRLEYLGLRSNALTGSIPSELGHLVRLEGLNLGGNNLTGRVPEELGRLEQLASLELFDNALTGPLPASLMNLRKLERLYFFGQELCAPADPAFQAWLSGIPDWQGPNCAETYALAFAGTVDDQQFELHVEIDTLWLPEVTGGISPYSYVLRPPLPSGLVFDAQARSITGTPLEVAARTSYRYTARDSSLGFGTLKFYLEVVEPAVAELPEQLALSGNFPNPFSATTVVSYDLPARARVSLHVFDVLGRRILVQSEASVEAGWQRTLTVDGRGLAPGVYLYQLIADLQPEPRIERGQMVLVR